MDSLQQVDARHAIGVLRNHYEELTDSIDAFEIKIVAHARRDQTAHWSVQFTA